MKEWEDLPEGVQEKYISSAVKCLSGLYWCSRVWDGWSAGTMTQDDFINAEQDDDIVNDTASTIYKIHHNEKIYYTVTNRVDKIRVNYTDIEKALNYADDIGGEVVRCEKIYSSPYLKEEK